MAKSIYTREYTAVTRLLRETREATGLTQVELAEKLGQSQSFVSKYERGERRLDVIQLRTVCLTLEMSLPEFVDRLEKVLRSRK
ncbi:MAG: helix-turn-helix transcriptional regulator [Planctomycetia bacterium]|nr:helix-turn-helix transcriptional regulator [Planctomycetia bacterium]